MQRRILHILFLYCFFSLGTLRAGAQCASGYTQCQLNWDNLDVFYNGGSYSSYITDAQEMTQRFGIGPNMMTMTMSSSVILTSSETNAHTGELAGFEGDDVQFSPSANGVSITLTFTTPVLNLSFALYDIDRSASYTISAADPSAGALTVTATPEASTILSISGSPGKTVTASSTDLANSSNQGSVTIFVAGSESNPVKTVVISIPQRGSDVTFFMSDINACVSGSFPTNWHQGFDNQPFTGNVENQPDYFLITPDNNSCYMMDPATGRCWWLFTDATRTYMNSFAYDPDNKILYYITENPSLNSGNKQLKKYDFNTESSSVVINDIETTLGIPTYNAGIESAAGAFYDGYLYLGIEGGQSTSSIRESVVYKVDLTNNTACQVYGTPSYNGSGIVHDWADFLVRDGELINYNSARRSSNYGYSSYTHFNFTTGAATTHMNPSPERKFSGQAGMNWSGTMYMIYDSVWSYNAGAISFASTVSVVSVPGDPAPPAWNGNAGDGSDPFRPKCDFGDAPASYDPNNNAPAVHERSEAIRLGATWDREWLKRGVTANNDVDDGAPYVPFLASGSADYVVSVTVYNNNGNDATLIAWLDYNGNGVFDASEAIPAITVPSSASDQNFYLYWPNASNSFTNGSVTYLRIRITSGAMTANDATGYFSNGEVEDYRVLVDDYPLSTAGLSLNATLQNDRHAAIEWTVDQDGSVAGYQLERSGDSRQWETILIRTADGSSGNRSFKHTDENIPYGTSYYRIRLIGSGKYSNIRSVKRIRLGDVITVRPNPASDRAVVSIESNSQSAIEIILLSLNGRELKRLKQWVEPGVSEVELPIPSSLPDGTYILQVRLNNEIASRKLVIHK